MTIANPFDIHTYLWFDPPALRRVFSTVLRSGYDAVGFMLDCPPESKADTASFDAVIDVFIDAARGAPAARALIASLPETISARIRRRCMDGGVIPLQGQREALEALALAGAVGNAWRSGPGVQLRLPPVDADAKPAYTLSEHDGKAALLQFGVAIPRGALVAARQGRGLRRLPRFPGGDQGGGCAPRAQDRGRRSRAQHSQRRRCRRRCEAPERALRDRCWSKR